MRRSMLGSVNGDFKFPESMENGSLIDCFFLDRLVICYKSLKAFL